MPALKDQFRNDSGGVAGAVIIDGTGKTVGIAVQPGDTVWLSEEEQAFTANAPRREEDNPLFNGTFSLITEGADMKNARPLRPAAMQEVGAAPVATVEAPEGSRPPGEEVATPDAVPQTEVAHDGKTVVKKPPVRKNPGA